MGIFTKSFSLTAVGLVCLGFTSNAAGVPLSGTGTEADPYVIATADDWVNLCAWQYDDENSTALRRFTGKYIKLTADIDLTGKTFDLLFWDEELYGTFDGDNHTIKGISITSKSTYTAVISKIAASGVVKNLTVEGTISSTHQWTGGLTAEVYGTVENCTSNLNITSSQLYTAPFGTTKATAVLKDCTNKGTVTGSANGATIGGISSWAYNGASFTNCVNEGTLTISYTGRVQSYSGGILGRSEPGVTIVDCVNKGEFGHSSRNVMGLGGIIGYLYAGNTQKLTMTRCSNSATIAGWCNLGGLVATVAGAVGSGSTISECFNTGQITGYAENDDEGTRNIAGLVSRIPGGVTMTKCYNTARVMAAGDGDDGDPVRYIGGIAGAVAGATAALPAVIDDCYNTGTIQSTTLGVGGIIGNGNQYFTAKNCYNSGNVSAGAQWAGGIIGQMNGCTVENCYNTGKVNCSTQHAGGIAGYTGAVANGKINNCYNTGAVTTVMGGAGGILGGGLTYAANINNCWNSGAIKAEGKAATAIVTAGGIMGFATTAVIQINGCANFGDVTTTGGNTTQGTAAAAKGLGGIMGYSTGNVSFTDCYNTGKLTGTANSVNRVGGIAGSNNNSVSKFTNCYNTGEIAGPAANTGSLTGFASASVNNYTACYYFAQTGTETRDAALTGDGIKAVTSAELAAVEFASQAWNNWDAYTYPTLKQAAPDQAILQAAQYFLSEADTQSNVVTGSFNVGAPEGLTWTASTDKLIINGTSADWDASGFKGDFTLTKSVNELSQEYKLTANVAENTSAIDGIEADAFSGVTRYYNMQGVEIKHPKAGQIYIVVDGKRASKQIVK